MPLADRLPRPVVLKYYAFMATASAGLSIPIWVVFLRAQGLSYTEIMVLDGIWWVGIVAGEIPTGFVGDRVGWRNSLVVGNAIKAVAVVAMGLSPTFGALAAVYLLWAVGATLQSGSRDAWLYEVLDRRLDSDAFTRIRGRGQAITLGVGAVGSVAGGYVGAVNLSYPFLATGVLWVVGLVVLLRFPSVSVDPDDRISALEALPTIRDSLARPPLRRVVLWIAVVFGVLQAAARFTQPVAVDLGVAVADLGWLYAGFTLVAAVASYRADAIRDRFGLSGWLAAAPLGVGILFVGAWVAPLLAFPAFVAIRAVRSATRPMANQYVNDRVESAGRATVLSGASMVYSLVAVPLSVGMGLLADARLSIRGLDVAGSPLAAIGVAGVALVVATLAVHAGRAPEASTDATDAD